MVRSANRHRFNDLMVRMIRDWLEPPFHAAGSFGIDRTDADCQTRSRRLNPRGWAAWHSTAPSRNYKYARPVLTLRIANPLRTKSFTVRTVRNSWSREN
jgi:hypothetical protein